MKPDQELQELIVITPTYPRQHRRDYLQRCIAAFRNVRDFFWIVVEDGAEPDAEVGRLLLESGIKHVYLCFGPTRSWGNQQRNFALKHIKDRGLNGVVYLADDDNFYDPALFEEIRKTRRVAVFPVGHLGPRQIERPKVRQGRVVGWDADWLERKYPVDMAGFSFHSSLLNALSGELWTFQERGGESEFLERIVSSGDELELLCGHCTHCLVWHDQPLGELPLVTYIRRRLWRGLRGAVSLLTPSGWRRLIQKRRQPAS